MQLRKHPGGWLAGGDEPTSGDYMLFFPIEVMETTIKDIPQSLKEYSRRVQARTLQVSSMATSPKLVVHYLANSRVQRILWLLEELELPYKVKRYERLPSLLAPPELQKIHPLGKSVTTL
ncbi:hypothetical protein FRB99_003848 [Tulasnella sp. 403]|nr:hypothetical protein FRB99_003848 [Tulasnella sp. 403]